MLHLVTILALTSAVVTAPSAPAASPTPSLAVNAPAVSDRAPAARSTAPANARKRPLVEFPWTRYLTVEQQNAEMRSELDRFFNVDHSP
jgi:hypothetical protein